MLALESSALERELSDIVWGIQAKELERPESERRQLAEQLSRGSDEMRRELMRVMATQAEIVRIVERTSAPGLTKTISNRETDNELRALARVHGLRLLALTTVGLLVTFLYSPSQLPSGTSYGLLVYILLYAALVGAVLWEGITWALRVLRLLLVHD